MNEILLRNKHEVFVYTLKDGTATSYYLSEGAKNILPERIGFSKNGFTVITNKGRALLENKVGQLVGCFTKKEESHYKKNKPYKVFSSVWEVKDYPSLYGYGDIGISNISGRIESSKDVFVIYTSGLSRLEIHLFRGLIEFKDSILRYVNEHKKLKP